MTPRRLALATATLAAIGFTPLAHATWTGSFNDGVNGVSGTLTDLGLFGGAEKYTLTFTMGASGAAVGTRITSVDIKGWGGDYSSYTFTASAGTWGDGAGTGPISSGGAAGVDGCQGGSGSFACIQAGPTLQDALIANAGSSYTFNFSVLGAQTVAAPTLTNSHVGIGFTQFDGTGNAGIVSTGVASPIPEPEIYAMLFAGLGFLGFEAKRRKRKSAT